MNVDCSSEVPDHISAMTMSCLLKTPLHIGNFSASGSQQDQVGFQFSSIGNLQILCRSIHGAAHNRGWRAGLAGYDWSFLAVVS